MKKIVIFGAASAIAQATARIWAAQGAAFVLIDRNEDRLKVVADDLKARGAKEVHTITADLADMDKHVNLVKQIQQHMTPTVYFFAYGTLTDQQKGQSNFAYTHDELHLNFVSVASLLTEIVNVSLAKSDLKNRGNAAAVTLAAISSVAGDRGRGSNYIYGTAKGALTLWLSGLRNRLTRDGSSIHVLTIKPGFVDTPMTKDFKKGLLWVKPEVIAHSIVHSIETKKDVVYVPWFWRYIMLIIKCIPEVVFKKVSL